MTSALLLTAETTETTGGGWATSLVFFGLIFAAMWFLMIRPQRRRMRESQALQSAIAQGDEVVLNSGIYGFVTLIEGDVLWLDIADGHGDERIEIRVSRGAVARRIPPATNAE
ncbi:MAG: preprotein translocase subunit YajC [Actinomycetota bacterium]